MRQPTIKQLLFLFIYFFGIHLYAQTKTSDTQIEKLLSQMTIEDKVGEMTQLSIDMICVGSPYNLTLPMTIDKEKLKTVIQKYHVGSILNVGTSAHTPQIWQSFITEIQNEVPKTRLKIPILYGIDAIHGVSYTSGSTLYPQPIAMAATWNPKTAEDLAAITAYECRASGIPWVFSPAMDLNKNPVWPRTWESFGEDVLLNTTFGSAMVKGYQGTNLADKNRVAACLKHFTGYGAATSGKDRTTALIPERQLREYYLPQYAEAIKNGALTAMINSGEFNGIPSHANKQLLTDILKGELGLKGFAVSDWEDVKYLFTRHHVAASYKDAIKMAINAGIDMTMVPNDLKFPDLLVALVNEKQVPISRIDDAVRRILYVKKQLGLFNKTHYALSDYPKFGSEEFKNKSLDAARESVVLLKNDKNILPLSKQSRALVVGPTANSMRSLNGGWTDTWQGENADKMFANKNTIVEAIKNKIGEKNVSFIEGADFDKLTNFDEAIKLANANSIDYIVLCLGETSYTETPGSISDLTLNEHQLQLAEKLAATGKPIVLVLAEGRPRLISRIADKMNGTLLALYGGPEGGDAIADVLYGDYNPGGKMPLTYPKYPNAILPYDHRVLDDGAGAGAGFPQGANQYFDPQFEFGFGLSYTTFAYSNLKISKDTLAQNETLTIKVDVTNTGSRDGAEVVQLYVSDLVASIAPPVKRLRGFQKQLLKAGETKTLQFNISPKDLAFVGIDNKFVTEPGTFKIAIGKLVKNFELK